MVFHSGVPKAATRSCMYYKGREKTGDVYGGKSMKPDLTITRKNSVQTVEVEYDRGDKAAAFELMRQALPAIEQLDECTRHLQKTGEAS